MVASNTNLTEIAGPQTQCSHCSTLFEVPQELLESSDTRVKCGECFNIFDALDGLLIKPAELPMTAALASLSAGATNIENNKSELSTYADLDVTYSDFDLFSEDADTPYLDYFEETSDPVSLDFDSVEIDKDKKLDKTLDKTLSDTLFRHDVTVDPNLPVSGEQSPVRSVPSTASSDLALGAQPRIEIQSEVVRPKSIEFDYDKKKRISPRDPIIEQSGSNSVTDSAGGRNSATDHEVVNLRLGPTVTAPNTSVRNVDSVSKAPESYDVDASIDTSMDTSMGTSIETTTRSRNWLMPLLMVMSLVLLFTALYLYRERASLSNDPMTRPIYVASCAVLGCQVPALSDLDQLRVLRRYIFAHPSVKDALVVNVVFRNEAEFEQRYPILVINMSDITGKVVATRNFEPSEYLPAGSLDEKQTLEAQTTIEVSLAIEDPGENANSFTLDFR